MDIPRYIDESEQSWARWHDIEGAEGGESDLQPGIGPMREVIITPVPDAGQPEAPFVVRIPIVTRDIPA